MTCLQVAFVPTDVLINKGSQRVFVTKLTMVEGNGGKTLDGVADDTRGNEKHIHTRFSS